MSRVCSICGKTQMSGNNVSHSNRKTRTAWKANLQKQTFPAVDKNGNESTVTCYVCTRCLRTQKKNNK